ncbi:MAG: UbiA family prenyltransferase [Nanoarchaeota archaeon]|nr:UbiA family prenyltransferase [Nanoarchaeota archaeon]
MFIWLELLRLRQWYKNLLVFLPLIFVGQLFDYKGLLLLSVAFVALCFVSSAGYIINDIKDGQLDKKHPEKRMRPIASGKIALWKALLSAILLILASLLISAFLSPLFLFSVIALFLMMCLYTFWLKKEAFADIIAISSDFVIRAVSGAFVINVTISPWIILCVFFLGLFLAAGKRLVESQVLSAKSIQHRSSLKDYTPEMNKTLFIISAVLLVMSYSLYSFMSIYPLLIFSMPFALYTILRFLLLANSGAIALGYPLSAFKDRRMIIGALLWVITLIIVIYALG